ncbi:hypothetical protein D9M71_694820 [compost metagenome]
MQGDQGPDLRIQPRAHAVRGLAIRASADQEAPFSSVPLARDKLPGDPCLFRRILIRRHRVECRPRRGEVDVVLGGFPVLLDLFVKVPVVPPTESGGRLPVVGVLLRPVQGFARGRKV